MWSELAIDRFMMPENGEDRQLFGKSGTAKKNTKKESRSDAK